MISLVVLSQSLVELTPDSLRSILSNVDIRLYWAPLRFAGVRIHFCP